MASSPDKVTTERYHRARRLRILRSAIVWRIAARAWDGSLSSMSDASVPSGEIRCEVCGRFEAVEVGDHRLCEACYAEAGTCGGGGGGDNDNPES